MDVTRTRSAIAKVRWPAVPTPRGAQLLALQYQLDQSQWWPEAELRYAQWHQLAGLVAHATTTVPFYRRRLELAGIDPKTLRAPDAWSNLPTLSREDVQEAGDALVSTALPPDHGRTHIVRTSGSSGAPVRVTGTELTQLFWLALTLRHHLWHGDDFAGKLATIRFAADGRGIYPDGVSYPSWGGAVAPAFMTGPGAFLNAATPIAQQSAWLQTENPDYLITYPSNLAALIEWSHTHNIRYPNLRNVQTLGEVVPLELRVACRDAWGIALVDMYSSQEAGYIALQCPLRETYHVQSETVLVEVLDETGHACKAGETGRVVVTPLHNFAMPLLRYAIGDYATVGEPCTCGRGLPVLNRIVGRARNMLTLPNGERIWPSFGGYRFYDIAPVRQFRLIQKTRQQLELILVVQRPLSAEEEEKLRALILQNLRAPFEIAFIYTDAITRGPGGKYEDFHSELEP
jgi:phenylacetate-coenzyme A ligase PaaK-like adenylate-forming protein